MTKLLPNPEVGESINESNLNKDNSVPMATNNVKPERPKRKATRKAR